MRDDDRAYRLIDCEQFRMCDVNGSAIRQMNAKRMERLGLMQATDLINCHREFSRGLMLVLPLQPKLLPAALALHAALQWSASLRNSQLARRLFHLNLLLRCAGFLRLLN